VRSNALKLLSAMIDTQLLGSFEANPVAQEAAVAVLSAGILGHLVASLQSEYALEMELAAAVLEMLGPQLSDVDVRLLPSWLGEPMWNAARTIVA
jgi:hypothetical protein